MTRDSPKLFVTHKHEASTESENKHLETFRAITHNNFMAVKSNKKKIGLGFCVFYFIFSNDSFLLYFIKVLIHEGLKFIKNGGRGA